MTFGWNLNIWGITSYNSGSHLSCFSCTFRYCFAKEGATQLLSSGKGVLGFPFDFSWHLKEKEILDTAGWEWKFMLSAKPPLIPSWMGGERVPCSYSSLGVYSYCKGRVSWLPKSKCEHPDISLDLAWSYPGEEREGYCATLAWTLSPSFPHSLCCTAGWGTWYCWVGMKVLSPYSAFSDNTPLLGNLGVPLYSTVSTDV